MGRTGVAVDAAMFTALVGVDGPVETDVRTGVPRDAGPGVLGRQGGAQGRRLDIVRRPAVIEGLDGLRFEPPGSIRPRPPSLRRFSHDGKDSSRIEQIKNIYIRAVILELDPRIRSSGARCVGGGRRAWG